MIQWVMRKRIRRSLQQLVVELFHYNPKDVCFDPLGSLDRDGMIRAIEVIARGKLPKDREVLADRLFSRKILQYTSLLQEDIK